MASTEELTELLSDLTFPATREQIIQHARSTGATEDVLDDIRTLPNEEYVDSLDVWKHIGLVKEEPSASAGDELATEKSDIIEPRWKCPSCEVTFGHENEYRQHMLQEHEEAQADIEL